MEATLNTQGLTGLPEYPAMEFQRFCRELVGIYGVPKPLPRDIHEYEEMKRRGEIHFLPLPLPRGQRRQTRNSLPRNEADVRRSSVG